MNKKALFFAGFLVACSDAGTLPDNPFLTPPEDDPGTGEPSDPQPDAGFSDPEFPDDELPEPDAGVPGDGDDDASTEQPIEEVPNDELGDILESIAELTTCKPSEINPVMDCLSVTCQGDALSSVFCIVTDCLPLIQKVNPKCGDCMMAAISQDTLGLLNCVDIEGILTP